MGVQLVFLHGLESGPHGSKFKTLSDLGLGPVLSPNCKDIDDPLQRLAIIREALADAGPLLLVGSSFGGLMALLYAQAWPAQVVAMETASRPCGSTNHR